MEAEKLIEKVLNLPDLVKEPPVLIDIGASGEIHPEWKLIAKHSVCVAFDADDRDFKNTEASSGYKQIHLINAIVSNREEKETDFYLTASPHCSSSLLPLNDELSVWSFSNLFRVEKKIKLKNISLPSVLKEKNIQKIDWFKTDSQGTDLRLFLSMEEAIQKNSIVVQFEPGIINAYKNEDKFHTVLSFMDSMPYWAAEINIMGSKRISESTLKKYELDPATDFNFPNSSCWGEITYFNTFEQKNSNRDILLGWVFATIRDQHGFALDILNKENTIEKSLLNELERFTLNAIQPVVTPVTGKQRIKNKLINIINKL